MLYHLLSQYKELESANKLTEGPIDLQYSRYVIIININTIILYYLPIVFIIYIYL